MKAISLWQPWASLIACGVKPFETRDWAPPRALVGQVIAIHAAKRVDRNAAELAESLVYGQHPAGGHELADRLANSFDEDSDVEWGKFGEATLPVGCVVCLARLDAWFRLGEPAKGTAVPAASVTQSLTSRPMPVCFTVRYDPWGDYSPGRYAWLLSDVRPVKPAARAVGRQGFFDLPPGWLAEARP